MSLGDLLVLQQSVKESDRSFSEERMQAIVTQIMDGEWGNEQIAAFLMGLSMRGETVSEITGAARVLRQKLLPINAPTGAVDCCGTGGDGLGTYNISTAVAIVAAACGVPVAKHGNRSASSKSGAADVLEALGINLNVPQSKLEEALKLFNFAFLMAPRHHEAMKYVVPVRKSLGVRTMFNLLGPLANPAGTQHQLIGVYNKSLIMPIAEVLKRLGTKSAWVVHGSDGLDEITVTGETFVAKLDNGVITEDVISPHDFGLKTALPEDLVGGTPEVNAEALLKVLRGADNAYRDIVLANTAAVLVVAKRTLGLKGGVEMAIDAIESGKAFQLLNNYIEYTQEHGEA